MAIGVENSSIPEGSLPERRVVNALGSPDPALATGSSPTRAVTERGLRRSDRVYGAVLLTLSSSVVGALLLVSYQLWSLSGLALHQLGWSFLTSSGWDPTSGVYGALPFVAGTVVTAVEAL